MSTGEEETRKPLLFLEGSIKSPPFTAEGREEAGTRLREIIVDRTDPDRILIVAIFAKTTERTPKPTIDHCKKRLRDYDA